MRFIGQYIQDFIARFRNDVYLQSISSGTIVSGGNLGLDSNNKIVKASISASDLTVSNFNADAIITSSESFSDDDTTLMTSAAIDDQIQARTSGLGDITQVGVAADTHSVTATSGYLNLIIAGGEGIDTSFPASNSGGSVTGTITIAGEDASTSNKGIASFSSDNFSVSSGAVNIKSGGVDLSDEVTGTLPVANGGTGVTSLGSINISSLNNDSGFTTNTGDIDRVTISTSSGNAQVTSGNADFSLIGSTSISVTNSGTNITISSSDASESAKGIVELATTSEADTGTDTVRAVTPAGLKSHVDTKFSYQYISFNGNADIATNWAVPGTNGPFTHNYNTDTGINGTTVDSTSFSLSRLKQNGFVVPFDNAVLVGFYGMMRNNDSNSQGALGLFHSTYATFGAKTGTATFTLRAYNVGDTTGGASSNYQGFTKVVDLSRSLDLTAGDIIVPAILQANDKVFAQFTIVIKTPLT